MIPPLEVYMLNSIGLYKNAKLPKNQSDTLQRIMKKNSKEIATLPLSLKIITDSYLYICLLLLGKYLFCNNIILFESHLREKIFNIHLYTYNI